VPEGESKYDKKGSLRADGFKLVIVPEEARIIQRIFGAFIAGAAIMKIAKELNKERLFVRGPRREPRGPGGARVLEQAVGSSGVS
jgi:hypothetical protein